MRVCVACVHLSSVSTHAGCPVAHLVPVELFTKQLRSVMRPLSTICSLPGQAGRRGERRMGWDGIGSGQKIHDRGREEMVKDMGGGGVWL